MPAILWLVITFLFCLFISSSILISFLGLFTGCVIGRLKLLASDWYDDFLTNAAGAECHLTVLSADAHEACLSPVVTPGVLDDPVFAARLAQPIGTETHNGHCVVGHTQVRAATLTCIVHDDATGVVLDAVIYEEVGAHGTLAHKLGQINPKRVTVGLKVINLESFHSFFFVFTSAEAIAVRVVGSQGQALVFGIAEGILRLTTHAADIGNEGTVNKLLFTVDWHLIHPVSFRLLGCQRLNSCHG